MINYVAGFANDPLILSVDGNTVLLVCGLSFKKSLLILKNRLKTIFLSSFLVGCGSLPWSRPVFSKENKEKDRKEKK